MFDNIPDELKRLPQFVCWKYEDLEARKPTKIPVNPISGRLASVTDFSTWVSFETACLHAHKYSGIGFVFSANDPYAFIDLDDTSYFTDGSPNPNADADHKRQKAIFEEFDSYSELSPSGKGLHVIVKANVLAGRRRSFVEVYSSMRYATMTGNVFHNKPIQYRQDMLQALWGEMHSGEPKTILYKGTEIEAETDTQIINQGLAAVNGDKFKNLLHGNWQIHYPSQSEADFAFIDILAFYSKNKNQVTRIFANSILGQRDKAKRTGYISGMVDRSFDRMLPPIDIEGFKNAVELKIAQTKLADIVSDSPKTKIENFDTVNSNPNPAPVAKSSKRKLPELPPGLMGEIAQFIYQAAPRPVPEFALAGAMGLMGGICGRAYNVSGTGLNQYLLALGNTGTGKEGIPIGIDKIMNAVKSQVPTSTGFLGPSEIASGQALIKYMANTSQCFVSILGEFGIRLQQMSSITASASDNTLRRMLLDLYNKSGFGQSVRPSIYSDKDKNTQTFNSPALTILGESTPERFYSHLNEDMISEGLLPRFTVIEYLGDRPVYNENHLQTVPTPGLIQRVADLAAIAETLNHNKRVVDVPSTPEAHTMLKAYDKLCDGKINGTNKDIVRQLWNRAHIKVLKLSALVAVGVNMSHPVVTAEHVKWAIALINEDITNFTTRFESGEVGANTNETRQIKDMIYIIKSWLTEDFSKFTVYTKQSKMHNDKAIPNELFNKRLGAIASFRNDRMGATFAIKRTLQMMIDADDLREVPRMDVTAKYGTTQRAFVLRNMSLLE